RVYAAREVAQLLERLVRSTASLGEQILRARWVGAELLLGEADAHAERDEPCLCTVVQVALDPAQLRLLRVDRAGTRLLERLDPPGQLPRTKMPAVGDERVDCQQDPEPDQRPDRPEVVVGRERPRRE